MGWKPASARVATSTIQTSWISSTETACEENSSGLSSHSATATTKLATSHSQRKLAGPFSTQ